MEQETNSTSNKPKPKAIIFLCKFFNLTMDETKKMYLSHFSKPNNKGRRVLEEIDYRVVLSNEIDLQPFGDSDPGVEILMINAGPQQATVDAYVKRYPSIKWIHVLTAGVNQFMTPVVKAHPCVVTNGKGSYSESLTEGIIFYMLWFCKKANYFLKKKAERAYDRTRIDKLSSKTLGKN